MSGRRITTISLDDESYHQSQNIGNLSAFVRQKLQEEQEKIRNVPVDYHNAMHSVIGRCHPHNGSDGYCSICWPYGQPSKNEWLEYTRAWYEAKRNRQVLPNAPRQSPDRRPVTHTNEIAQQESRDASVNKGIIRKLWNWIF